MNISRVSFVIVLCCSLVACSSGNGGAPTQVEDHPGQKIYRKYCRSCHQGGLVGSPIFGDEEAWSPRIEKGREVLLANTINGIPPGMPKRGACTSCTDEELDAAIDFILEAVSDAKEVVEPE